MGFPDRSRSGRIQLAVELLEDRTTPAKLDDAVSLALPELTATGAVAGDRVNVVMTAETNNDADTAALAAAPFAASVKSLGFGIYSVTLAPGTDLATAIAYYGQSTGVVSAAADAVVQADKLPNDPSYSSLYGMTKIGAPAAWDKSTGNSNFVVAVIDTGINYNHPDLAANVWTNPGEIAGNGIDDDGDGFVDDVHGWDFVNNDGDPMDDNGHGSHVSGTIGAVGNNGVGVAGVNWSVQIMGLKFLNAQGSGYTSAAVSALNFAVNHGVKLSNNSWGGGGADSSLAAAIGRARTAGHIFVAAAGNSGLNIDSSPSYPASYIQTYDNVVTVAATDSNDALASFSNYGASSVTLAAPGVGILSTTLGTSYSSYSGTSMATPHVTGAIALHWAAKPSLTYAQEIAVLKSSVDPISGLSGKVATGGRLNVAKMFINSPVDSPGPKVSSIAYSGQTNTQFDKLTITFDRAINPDTFTSEDIASFTGPGSTDLLGAITSITPVSDSNTQFAITFAAQTTPGAYVLVFGPDIRDTSDIQMNQNGNGTPGESTDGFTASANLVLTVNKTYSTGTISVPIPDLKTVTSKITVPDIVKITDLNVTVNITHTYDSDLVITLTGPTGKVVTLFNRRGGSGDNLSGTVFDDEASKAISAGRAPFAGSFRPEQALTAFDGLGTDGVWTLTVSDKTKRDIGTLTGWTLSVTGTVGSGGSGAGMTALGFRDEEEVASDDSPPLATASIADSIAEPIAVTAAEPARTATAEPLTVNNSTATTASLLAWMESRTERAPDEVPVASDDRDEGDFSFPASADSRLEVDDPFAAASAMLYLAPEESADVANIFDVFAVE